MLSIGHALVGDRKYNPTKRAQRQTKWCDRLFLHAQRLQFDALPALEGNDDSETSTRISEAVDVSVSLTPELQAVLQGMRVVENIDAT